MFPGAAEAIAFQFLSVRLKVNRSKGKFKRKKISIPFGAIKRVINFVLTPKDRLVSIPFGAIKSASLDIFVTKDPLFQFLSVRLKEFCTVSVI